MIQWEYCELNFDGSKTFVYFYDEVGDYIDRPERQTRLGLVLARLGHDGWEVISAWWRNDKTVTYLLKRPCQKAYSEADREQAKQAHLKNRQSNVLH